MPKGESDMRVSLGGAEIIPAMVPANRRDATCSHEVICAGDAP